MKTGGRVSGQLFIATLAEGARPLLAETKLQSEVFQAKVDCFADVGEGFGDGFPLRVTTWQRGADHRIAAVLLIWFQEDFKVVRNHLSHRSEAPGGMQEAQDDEVLPKEFCHRDTEGTELSREEIYFPG